MKAILIKSFLVRHCDGIVQ